MAGSAKPLVHGPWPRGVDNISLDQSVPADALRSVVNADILDDGAVRLRPGSTLRVAGNAHSAWGYADRLYAVVDGVLTAYTKDLAGVLTGTALRTGMSPDLPVSYLGIANDVYYTNNAVSGKIASGVHRPWGVERPTGQPVLAALTSGALHAGRYQVGVTFVDNLGEESGTGPLTPVQVAAGGGIQLSLIPQPANATVSKVRVYVSEANGEVLYRYADVAVGTTSLNIARSATLGKVLDTQFLFPPVPGIALESFNGRIYIARSNLVFYTDALRYGAMRQTNYFAFENEVRLIKAGATGLWVATAADTHLLLGTGPENMQLTTPLSRGAVRGSAVDLPNGRMMWVSSGGPVVIGADDQIEELGDDPGDPIRIALDDFAIGSAAVREKDGVRQIITTLGNGVASAITAQDYFDIEVIRKTA